MANELHARITSISNELNNFVAQAAVLRANNASMEEKLEWDRAFTEYLERPEVDEIVGGDLSMQLHTTAPEWWAEFKGPINEVIFKVIKLIQVGKRQQGITFYFGNKIH